MVEARQKNCWKVSKGLSLGESYWWRSWCVCGKGIGLLSPELEYINTITKEAMALSHCCAVVDGNGSGWKLEKNSAMHIRNTEITIPGKWHMVFLLIDDLTVISGVGRRIFHHQISLIEPAQDSVVGDSDGEDIYKAWTVRFAPGIPVFIQVDTRNTP